MSTGLTVLQQQMQGVWHMPEPTQEELKAEHLKQQLACYNLTDIVRFAYVCPDTEEVVTDEEGREIRSAYVYSCSIWNEHVSVTRKSWRAITVVDGYPVVQHAVTQREDALRALDNELIRLMMEKMGV